MKVYYAVLKIRRSSSIHHPFITVYDNIEEATKASKDGKYKVITITDD